MDGACLCVVATMMKCLVREGRGRQGLGVWALGCRRELCGGGSGAVSMTGSNLAVLSVLSLAHSQVVNNQVGGGLALTE